MFIRWQLLSLALICAAGAASARAQFAPPSRDPVTPPADGGIAPPTVAPPSIAPPGVGSLNISPPTPSTAPAPTGANPISSDDGPLKPLRPNVSMTTDAMIGFVNDQPFFLNDIFRPIDPDLQLLARRSHNLAEFRDGATAIIGSEIREQISESLEITAQEANLTDDDRQRIDIYLAKARSDLLAKYGGSTPAADRALAATGTSVNQEMDDLRRHACKDLYFSKNLAPRIVVTRQMVLDAYEKDPKRWQQTAQVEMYTITLDITRWLRAPSTNGTRDILPNPTDDQIRNAEHEALTTAYEIESKLRAGADFAKLAEDYESNDAARSSGGRTPQVTRGSMANAKFEDYVFSLSANTLGDPQLLRQPNFRNTSVVIVRVGKKTEARTVPFTEAQVTLAQELKQAQLRELQIQDMGKLSKGAAIEAVDRMLPVAVDAAITRYAMGTDH